MEFILSSEMKCPKSGLLKLIIAWGESLSDKAIMNENYYLQRKQCQFIDNKLFGHVRCAVFFGRCRNIFRAKMAEPALEK